MKSIKLNCDMGEGFGIYTLGDDAQIMPLIDMANLACGFHASDPLTMTQSIQLAKTHNVSIGAHPAYPDLVGFGRRAMQCSSEEITAFVLYQLGALDALCRAEGSHVSYLKPHGALYHAMMQEERVFRAILRAIAQYDPNIKLMILSTLHHQHHANIAQTYQVELLYEVFADRAYDQQGALVPRTQTGSLLHAEQVRQRAQHLLEEGQIQTIEGKMLRLRADTLCVHGDHPDALNILRELHAL